MTEIFEEFQEFRKILCVCPCCGEIYRISDLKLRVKDEYCGTWLDTFQSELSTFQYEEQKFSQKEAEIRKKGIEKGRKSANQIINNLIIPPLKKLKFNPLDIKPVFFPIDFVVFNGMNQKQFIDDIIFLSMKSKNEKLNSLRESLGNVVCEKNYEFNEARIEENGGILYK